MNDPKLVKKIADQLVTQARLAKKKGSLWNGVAEAILDGKVIGIDPRVHVRNPRPPGKIASDIHKLIGDGSTFSQLKPGVRRVYLELVKVVMKGLDY